MKNLIIIAVFGLLVAAPSATKAEKYIIFISGYGGDYWEKSGLPSEWDGNLVPKGNVLILDNTFINLPNEIQQVYASILAGNINAKIWFTDFLKKSIRTRMINLFDGDSDVEIILVGHSLGGFATRLLEDTINQFQFPAPIQNVKVIGVLNVATPHQGLRVSELSVGEREGFINVEEPLLNFKNAVREPLKPEYDNGWISWAVNNFAGSKAIKTLNDLPNIIDDSYASLIKQPFVGVTLEDGDFYKLELYAKGFFKENGIFPNLVNGISTNTPTRSVYGVEKASTAVRALDEVKGNGQEKETVDNVSSLRRYYKAQEDAWWIEHELEYYTTRHYLFGARKRANARKDEYKRRSYLWRDGRHAIEGIDRTWTDAIDAKRLVTYTYTTERYVGCKNDTPIRLPSHFTNPIDGPECLDGGWVTETHQSSSIVSQKNDAVSIPHFYTLKKADMDKYASTALSGGNYFYNDTEARGGYNHMEIRRLRRAYNDPGNGIVKGEKAKPMREAEQWIIELLDN